MLGGTSPVSRSTTANRMVMGRISTELSLYVLTHTRHMESPNLVASCVAKLDDTLPPYGCYTG
jgi:hypothetical protein